MICEKCGSTNPDGHKYCINCGYYLTDLNNTYNSIDDSKQIKNIYACETEMGHYDDLVVLNDRKAFNDEVKIFRLSYILVLIVGLIGGIAIDDIKLGLFAGVIMDIICIGIVSIGIAGFKLLALRNIKFYLPANVTNEQFEYLTKPELVARFTKVNEFMGDCMNVVNNGMDYTIYLHQSERYFTIYPTKMVRYILFGSKLKYSAYKKAINDMPAIAYTIQSTLEKYNPIPVNLKNRNTSLYESNGNGKGILFSMLMIGVCAFLVYLVAQDKIDSGAESSYTESDYSSDSSSDSSSNYSSDSTLYYENINSYFSFNYSDKLEVMEETSNSVTLEYSNGGVEGNFQVEYLYSIYNNYYSYSDILDNYFNSVLDSYYQKAQEGSLKYNRYDSEENNACGGEAEYIGAKSGKKWNIRFIIFIRDNNVYCVSYLFDNVDSNVENDFNEILETFYPSL